MDYLRLVVSAATVRSETQVSNGNIGNTAQVKVCARARERETLESER